MQTKQCNACGQSFDAARKNKTYCSDNCRKKKSRNNAREGGDRKFEYLRRREYLTCRARELEELIYSSPPYMRLGHMQQIFRQLLVDSELRTIVTDPDLLSRPPRADMRQNIARCANSYSQMFFGLSIKTYVSKLRAGETIDEAPVRWPKGRAPKETRRNVETLGYFETSSKRAAYNARLSNLGTLSSRLVQSLQQTLA